MSNSITEFKRFLNTNSSSMDEHERKLSRIILENFDSIENKSSAGGARGKLLSELIQRFGKEIKEFISDKDYVSSHDLTISKIHSLKVSGFRGFSNTEEFDLSKKYSFFYGPNGTGKSSFCEALEYALTGKIYEANSKRFGIEKYIQNNTSKKSSVLLTVEYEEGKQQEAIQSSLENEFIFIERNRIEGFARVSAFTPQGQQTRLSTLFGLDQYNSFCSGFSKSIENKLPVNPIKERELIEKEKEVESYKLIIENKQNELNGYEQRKQSLLSKYQECKLVTDVITLIHSDKIGLLDKDKNELDLLSKIQLHPIEKVSESIKNIDLLDKKFKKYETLEKEVSKHKDEINFIDLYTSILEISNNNSKNICPACDTPLEKVTTNPYSKANDQLGVLKNIAIKQNEVINLKAGISNDIIKYNAQINALGINSNLSFESFYEKILEVRGGLNLLKNTWSESNRKNSKIVENKNKIQSRIRQLEGDLSEAKTLSELYKAAYKEKGGAEKYIGGFNEVNKLLIEAVKEEKLQIEFYIKYARAYEGLINKLKQHAELLPLKLSDSLEVLVLEIYNSINEHSYDHEILETLSLPTKPNEIIQIRYKDGLVEDALRVLSEGHLRCLGLSILLAKNIHDKHNIVIFDDVVNAIDDEHRSGVIRVLFTNEKLSNKQMILTTHGEDFVKRLENELPAKGISKKLIRYDFIKNYENRDILIEQNINRQYLIKAQSNLKKGLIKDTLMECRRSLEDLSVRLWKKIRSEGFDPYLSVKLRSPNDHADLYNLITGLTAYIETIEKKPGVNNFTDHKKCLQKIRDVSKKHPITWTLLNKGTHQEDRNDEFDDVQAQELLKLCLELETLIKSYDRSKFIQSTVPA